jgi:hypothetical protein
MAPSAIDSNAAISTRYSGGSKKVIVCAGIQKKGIVLSSTNDLIRPLHVVQARDHSVSAAVQAFLDLLSDSLAGGKA